MIIPDSDGGPAVASPARPAIHKPVALRTTVWAPWPGSSDPLQRQFADGVVPVRWRV